MRTTIYLPDSLGERIKARHGVNVSAVCQAALEKELEKLEQIESDDLVTLDLEDGRTVGFRGALVAYDGERDVSFYVTANDAVVVYHGETEEMGVFDTFAKFKASYGKWEQCHDVARRLGEPYIEILDI